MMALIVLLTAISVAFEIKLVRKVPALAKLLERFPLLSIFFSLGLSMMLGMFFGAAGFLVFVAGLLSTVVMVPYYAAQRNGWIDTFLAKAKDGKVAISSHQAELVTFVTAVREIILLVMKVVGYALTTIMFVLTNLAKGARLANAQMNKQRVK